MKRVIGYYNELRYTVDLDGKEVYQAGNSPFDSQVYADPKTQVVLPLDTMRQYCEQTSKDIAKEHHAKFVGVEYLEDEVLMPEVNATIRLDVCP